MATATTDETRELFTRIVGAEIKHWVPGASARLIHRAGAALGFPQPSPYEDDHGPDTGGHALLPDWAGGLYVLRCASCCRIFLP